MRVNRLLKCAGFFALGLGAVISGNHAKAVTRSFQTVKEQSYMENYNTLVYDMVNTSPLEVEEVDGVEPTSGHLKVTRTDLSLDGMNGMDLTLGRFYDSNDAGVGRLSVESVGSLDVNTHNIEFKNGFGKTKNVVVNDKIYKNKKQALKDLLFRYKRIGQKRKDVVENTEKTQVTSSVNTHPYQIAVGWYFDLPWIESYQVAGDVAKPKYLHLGSKGVIGICTTTTEQGVSITGFDNYTDSDIQLIKFNQTVDGIACGYLYRDKTGMRNYFNANGYLVMQKDNHNNTIKYYYDGTSLSFIVDSVGRKVKFNYATSSHGIKLLSYIEVSGKEIAGGISKKRITYKTHETSYETLDKNIIYGCVLDSVTESGTSEVYTYKEVESIHNTCGGGIGSQRATTNKTYLIKKVSYDGTSDCYEYRGVAMKNPCRITEEIDGKEKETFRNVVTNVFVVTRQYTREDTTGKRTNGTKYDYFLKTNNTLLSTADFEEVKNEFLAYRTTNMQNFIMVTSSFNAAKYKGNKKKSDYSVKKGRMNVSSLDLKKKPKKEISIAVYDSLGRLVRESTEGKTKSETLYNYQDGHLGLLNKETSKNYGNNRNNSPKISCTGYQYDSYRNLIETKDNRAFLPGNTGKEYLFATKNEYQTSGGFPTQDKAYSLDTIMKTTAYTDENTQVKTENVLESNGVDVKESKEEIKVKNSSDFEIISKTEMTYDTHGNTLSEQVYENMKDAPNSYIKTSYDYDAKGNQTKTTKNVVSEKHPEENKTYVEEESTYDDFGNELTVKDEKGVVTRTTYDEESEEEILVKEAVGTEKETLDKSYQSADKHNSLTLDQYGRGTVEIQDVYGNTIISKDEKAGTWTERTYDYEALSKVEEIQEDATTDDGELSESEDLSEADVDEDADDEVGCDQADIAENVEGTTADTKSTTGLLVEERVYSFEPEGSFLDEEGNPNFDIKGKGKEILSATKHAYDRKGNEVATATFSGGALDAAHCKSLTLSKSESNTQESNGAVQGTKMVSSEKVLNQEKYTDSFIQTVTGACDDGDTYYNKFDNIVLSEVITESITDTEGNVVKEITTSKAGVDSQIQSKTNTFDSFGKQIKDETTYSGTISGKTETGHIVKNEYTYDIYGNQTETKTTSKAGDKEISQTTKCTYDITGKRKEDFTPKGIKNQYATKHSYSITGVETETKNPVKKEDGKVIYQTVKSEYDNSGNLISKQEETTDGQYNQTDYTYDEKNNLVLVKDYNGTDTKDTVHYTQYLYDLDGNKIRQFTGMTEPLSISVKEGEGEDSFTSVKKEYHVVVKNPNKKNKYQETKYDYDKMGRLTSVTNPKGKAEKYSYDVYGNQTKMVARDGDTTAYSYDYQGRITKETAKDKGTGRETIHTFTYDAYGNTITKDDTKLTYDKLTGLVTKEEEKVNGKSIAKAYDYDLSGNRTEMKVDIAGNTALDVSYQYDVAGRLIQVSSDGIEIATYTYDEDGSLVSETKSETGVTTTYQYNYQGMVTDMKNKASDGEELSSFTCTYDLKGRKVSEDASIQTVTNKKQNTTKKYAYDQLNRLTKESQTGQEDISYTYDANNNRTGKLQGDYETEYQYNKNNELMRVDTLNRKTEKNETVIYRYDANGSQVATNPRKAPKGKSPYISLDVTLGSNKANENVVNHYNAKNELIRTLTKDKSVTYEYNADGLRTKKKNHDDITYYIWDGDQLVLELDKDAKVTKRYLRGNSLITTDNGKEEKTTYLTNPHGDVVQLLNKSGKVTKTYDYDAFGNEINPDEKDENPIRYAGEYFDVETGTQYLRARYYAPELGRFITRDTYTGEDDDSLSLHLYTYCANDGVNFTDPSGFAKYAGETELAGMSLVLDNYVSVMNNRSSSKTEWISNKKGSVITQYTSKLRVCTDGKRTINMRSSKNYGDLHHGISDTTSCFGKYVSADRIPYVVVPPSKKNFKFSCAVIVNRLKGDYLYCVVAEVGPEMRLGEVSIYAAWKMMNISPPQNRKVYKKHMIGNYDQQGSWEIILFKNSSPNPNTSKCGWKYKKEKYLNKQIYQIGQKCYKGVGKCLNI